MSANRQGKASRTGRPDGMGPDQWRAVTVTPTPATVTPHPLHSHFVPPTFPTFPPVLPTFCSSHVTTRVRFRYPTCGFTCGSSFTRFPLPYLTGSYLASAPCLTFAVAAYTFFADSHTPHAQFAAHTHSATRPHAFTTFATLLLLPLHWIAACTVALRRWFFCTVCSTHPFTRARQPLTGLVHSATQVLFWLPRCGFCGSF